MTVLKNSAYKTKAGVVESTVGLNLEAGAMVYSIADAALMICDGSVWVPAGGGNSPAFAAAHLAGQTIGLTGTPPPQPLVPFDTILVNNGGTDIVPSLPDIILSPGEYLINATFLFVAMNVPGPILGFAQLSAVTFGSCAINSLGGGELDSMTLTAGVTVPGPSPEPFVLALQSLAAAGPVTVGPQLNILKVG
jgi:hypothetical protein